MLRAQEFLMLFLGLAHLPEIITSVQHIQVEVQFPAFLASALFSSNAVQLNWRFAGGSRNCNILP
jgi:hypothetical protein